LVDVVEKAIIMPLSQSKDNTSLVYEMLTEDLKTTALPHPWQLSHEKPFNNITQTAQQ